MDKQTFLEKIEQNPLSRVVLSSLIYSRSPYRRDAILVTYLTAGKRL